MKDDIFERMDRWYSWATMQGIKLDRILIHPSDRRDAPDTFMGLPVVALGQR